MKLNKENIIAETEKFISEFNGFVVDIIIVNSNKITIELDTPQGISIGELEKVNRHLNIIFDNENNEFELTVSSPGMERPFKVLRQYKKNIGKNIKVKLKNGLVNEGSLLAVSENGIVLNYKTKESVEGKKKKTWVEKTVDLQFENIAETKKIITFN